MLPILCETSHEYVNRAKTHTSLQDDDPSAFRVWYQSPDCDDLLAAVHLPAGRSYDVVWCRRQRGETTRYVGMEHADLQ